jgi:hypothetical protein
MCRTQSGEPFYDYPTTTTTTTTTTTHSEYLYTTGYNLTSPKTPVGFEPVAQVSTQPTLERRYDVSTNHLGMLFTNGSPPWICRNLDRCYVNRASNSLGEQERAYIRTKEFIDDDILARLGFDLGTSAQDGGSSHKLGLNISPQLSGPSTSGPTLSLYDAAAQAPAEFDTVTYMAELDAPLPTNTGWERDPRPSLHISGVIDTSFTIPNTTPWSLWSEIPANEGLDGQGSVTSELNALSPEILVPTLSQQLLLGPQEHTINSGITSLQPPQLGRPRARTAPTVFRGTAPNTPLFYPAGSPISVPPSTPHSLVSSDCGSSPSTPFSQPRDLPSYGNHHVTNVNPRHRSASVSTLSRGRPLTQPRTMVERVLDPTRVRPHLPVHTDATQDPTSGGIAPSTQHLDVPLFDWFGGDSNVPENIPDSPSTPSNLSRASSTSSVHRRPRSRSRSGMPYPKPSSSATAGDGTNSPEHPKQDKHRKRNGRQEFPGQRLHIDEAFLETVLGDNPSLRMLLDNILGSPWRKDHTLEPNYGDENDKVTQGLDLPIEQGLSVLLAFILRAGDEYTCVLCKEAVSPRVPRQLGHVRGHIDLRPFPCEGCDACDPKYVCCRPPFFNQHSYVSIDALEGSFLVIFFRIIIDRQNRASVLTGVFLL